jgi:SAM-dependent methyltransferase
MAHNDLAFYDVQASVYEQENHLEVVESFFHEMWPMAAARPEGTWLLDLGCGTGLLTDWVAERGCPVIGVDGSREMLTIARRRCRPHGRNVRLVHDRLERFRVSHPCSIACLSGEVVNHLPTAAVLRRVLRNARRNLLPGGQIVFDTLNRFCFEEYWDDVTYNLEGAGGDLVMECSWDPGRRVGTVRMIGYTRLKSGHYEKSETELREYLHSDRTIRDALRAAGFERIRRQPWSPWSDQHLEPALDRNLWTARRPA